MIRPSLLFGALLALGLAGCGGGGGGGPHKASSIVVNATNDTIRPGATVALTAVVKGGGAVIWSVDGGDSNGTVTPGGVYTAPTTQGTYTVRATIGALSGTKTIVVTSGVAIVLTSPTTIPLTVPKSKLSFTAQVSGATNKSIEWTVTGVPGAIAADGTFTAPDAPGDYTIIGASHADTSKTVTAVVHVVANVNVRIKWEGKNDVVIALRPDKAPNTVANYVTLVNKSFYDGIVAHRYEPDFVIQWGDPLTKTLPLTDPTIGTGGPGYSIPFEVNDLSNVKYSFAMARSADKDSGGSQVYVNLADNLSLDHKEDDPSTVSEDEFNQGYVVFGAVNDSASRIVIDSLRRGDKIISAKVEAIP